MFLFVQRRLKKAATLPEVLIVLAILSTTLVGSMALLIQGLERLRDNEFEDVANQVMIQALEIAKSPADVVVSDNLVNTEPSGTELFFALDEDVSSGDKILERQSSDLLDVGCSGTSSVFFAGQLLGGNQNQLLVCVQIRVTPMGSGENKYFVIQSEVVYDVGDDERVNSIQGYRYRDFVSV